MAARCCMRRSARAVEVAGHSVSVVLGAHAADLAPLLSHSSASIVINRDWSEGMASSIRAGVMRLPGSCGGVMLVLADQAAVTAEDLRRLATTWRRQPNYIVAAQYGADARRAGGVSCFQLPRSLGAARRPRRSSALQAQSRSGGTRADGQRRDRHRHPRRPAASRSGSSLSRCLALILPALDAEAPPAMPLASSVMSGLSRDRRWIKCVEQDVDLPLSAEKYSGNVLDRRA